MHTDVLKVFPQFNWHQKTAKIGYFSTISHSVNSGSDATATSS